MAKAYKEDKTPAKADKVEKSKIEESPVDDQEILDRATRQGYVSQAKELFNTSADARKRFDWDWLTRDLFRRGYQFSRYDSSSKTVVISSRSNIKIPINLTWAQMRIISNQVTSFRPKWDVLPRGNSEDAITNARYFGKLLDFYFDKLKLRKKIKETVIQGLEYSVGGPWEIGYDDEKEDLYIWNRDPYDYYLDSAATAPEDAEYMFVATRRPIDEIKAHPDFKFYQDNIPVDKRLAESEYKQFLLQALKQTASDDNGVIYKKLWRKVRVTKENMDELSAELKENEENTDDLHEGEVLMRVVHYLDSLVDPMKCELLRRDHYPLVLYQADLNPLEIYGESWMKHVMPVNRVLNALESSVFKYNYKYAKGRIVMDKNSGVRIVTNEHGDIIEKNRGSEVTSLPLQPLPQSYQIQIENMRRYLEDLGGAHDVSLGRLPTGVKSGIGIAELKSADATNQQDLVDALEDFLCEVAKKIAYEISQNFDVPKVIKALGKGGKPEYFAVIGEKAGKLRNKKEVKIGSDIFDIATIGAEEEVRVTIGSWLAYTKSAQQDKLKELYQAGIIDQKTFLENAEFSDVDGIVDRTRKEEALKKLRGQPAQEGMPSDEEIAAEENEMMRTQVTDTQTAVDMVQPNDVHQVHLIVHQEGLGGTYDPIIEAHMDKHNQYVEQGNSRVAGRASGVVATPEQPMGPPTQEQSQALTPSQSPEEQALLQAIQGTQ